MPKLMQRKRAMVGSTLNGASQASSPRMLLPVPCSRVVAIGRIKSSVRVPSLLCLVVLPCSGPRVCSRRGSSPWVSKMLEYARLVLGTRCMSSATTEWKRTRLRCRRSSNKSKLQLTIGQGPRPKTDHRLSSHLDQLVSVSETSKATTTRPDWLRNKSMAELLKLHSLALHLPVPKGTFLSPICLIVATSTLTKSAQGSA